MKETPNFVRQERESRNLALDYALGVSILGLIPISGLLTLKLVVTTGLIAKMISTLLANVLQIILHRVLPIARVKIYRPCSTINFSKDYFRQQSQLIRESFRLLTYL